MEKGGDDGGARGTPKLTGTNPSGKACRVPCVNFNKKEKSCNDRHVPECAEFITPAGCCLETSVFTNTQLYLLRKKKYQQILQFTLRRMMNDR